MSPYKTILSSVAFIAIMAGCDASSENTPKQESKAQSELSVESIQKNDEVYASEDTLVDTLNQRALEMSEGEFIQKSIDDMVPLLVRSYVPDSYEEEILALDELQSENLLANREFVEELQAFYALSHQESNARAAGNISDMYDIVASLSEQVYTIIYNYLFGDVSLEDTYDSVVDSIFGEDNSTENNVTTTVADETASSSESSSSSEITQNSSSTEASSSSANAVEEVVDTVTDVVDGIKDIFTTDDESSSVAATSSSTQGSSSSANVVEEVVDTVTDTVTDVVDGVKDIFTLGNGSSSSSSSSSSSIAVSSSSSSSVSSVASSSSSSVAATSTLATFISTTQIPKVSSYSYPKAFWSNYTITSFDRVKERLNEGDSVLIKILVPAGASKVTLEAKGAKDFFDGSRVGVFSEDVGSACGENSVCSLETLTALRNDSTLFGAKFSDVVYEGTALSQAEYRYVVIYNKNGGSDDFSSMQTQITIKDKNSYNAWRDSAL